MKVSAKITKTFDNEKSLKAFANIVLDGSFVVKGLRVIESEKGMFVAMPSEKGHDGEYYNTAYPCTEEMKQQIDGVIFRAYASELSQNKSQPLDENTQEADDLEFD